MTYNFLALGIGMMICQECLPHEIKVYVYNNNNHNNNNNSNNNNEYRNTPMRYNNVKVKKWVINNEDRNRVIRNY